MPCCQNIYRLVSTLVLTVSVTIFANAQVTVIQKDSYEQHVEVITSKVLNEERTFTVQLPKSYYTKPAQKYPVIYRLDGQGNLPLITAVLERLQEANSAPEVIIIAIENTDRLRDFYPTKNNEPEGPVGFGGGADKFLEFLESELIPFVNSEYRTHDFKILSGASAAGVFSLYALQTKPYLFQAHVAFSPAIWWNYGASAKSTKNFIAKAEKLNNYLYVNIGQESGIMRERYDDMKNFIVTHKPEGLRFISDEHNNVPHGLTSVAGIFNAYKNLFLPLWMPARAYSGQTQSITEYYERLSNQYGQIISAPEWVIRELGYHFVNEGNLVEAIMLFKFDISLYPNLASAYDGLAYGYEYSELFENSLEQVNKALALSKVGDDGYEVYLRRKERLLKLIK